jgi:hypothetical protein
LPNKFVIPTGAQRSGGICGCLFLIPKKICHPDRTPNSCHATHDRTACASFCKESRMKLVNAIELDRNSGERSGGTCFVFPFPQTTLCWICSSDRMGAKSSISKTWRIFGALAEALLLQSAGFIGTSDEEHTRQLGDGLILALQAKPDRVSFAPASPPQPRRHRSEPDSGRFRSS